MMLPDGMEAFQRDALREALAQVIIRGFKAGFAHSQCVGQRVCTCEFCQLAYDDPDFGTKWTGTLDELAIPNRLIE